MITFHDGLYGTLFLKTYLLPPRLNWFIFMFKQN